VRAVRSSETLNPITCVHRGQIRLYSCAANSRATARCVRSEREPLAVCIHARVHRTGRLCARGFDCFWQRAQKAPATAFIGAAGSFYSAISAAGDARSATLYMACAPIFPVYAQREIKSRHRRARAREREREREREGEGEGEGEGGTEGA